MSIKNIKTKYLVSKYLLVFLIGLLAACGQQSEIKGPYDRVVYNDGLPEQLSTAATTLTGRCHSSSPLVFASPDLVGSPISATCTVGGSFSLPVTLTSTDGQKDIVVTQTDPAGRNTTDTFVTILDVNPPVLVNDTHAAVAYSTVSVSPLGFISHNILGNDNDAGVGIDFGSVEVIAPAVPPAPATTPYCTIGFSSTPFIKFHPPQGYSGTDTCTYQACDNLAQCSTATATFTVLPGSAPVANDDTNFGNQNAPNAANYTSNDTDPDSLGSLADVDLSLTAITSPSAVTDGVCAIGPGPNNISFTPVTNFYGVASCGYELTDYSGLSSNTGTITYNIPDALGPVTVPDTATVNSGAGPVTVDVAANDTDPSINAAAGHTAPAGNLDSSTVTLLSGSGGSCTFNPAAPQVQFSPSPGFTGNGSCSYQICDTANNCSTGIYNVTVNDGQPPVTSKDFYVTDTDVTTQPINVISNDFDPENALDPSSVTIFTAPPVAEGVCATDAVNPFFITFDPAPTFVGTSICTYQVCDLSANCSQEDIEITVNDTIAPIAVDDPAAPAPAAITNQNTPIAVTGVDANDSDPAGTLDPTTVAGVGSSNVGICAWTGVDVTFTPNTDYAGPATCSYQICDTAGNCDVADVRIEVQDVTAPTVIINQKALASQPDPTNVLPIIFDVQFSEAINPATFTSAAIVPDTPNTVTGGLYTILNAGDNINFVVQVNALTSSGDLSIHIPAGTVTDANGVAQAVDSTSTDNVVTYDGTAPAAPIALDPAETTDDSPDITISCEPGSYIQIVNSDLTPDPYPDLATAQANPCPAGGQIVLPSVPFPAVPPLSDATQTIVPIASDDAGNTTPGVAFDIHIDKAEPGLTITRANGQNAQTNSLPIFFDVVFNEAIDPSTFTSADIINSAGAGAGAAFTPQAPGGIWTITNSGDNQNFVVSINALTGNGFVFPEVTAGTVSDLAGNVNTASTPITPNDVEYDGVAPGAPVIATPTDTPDNTPDIVVSCEPGSLVQLSGPDVNPPTGVFPTDNTVAPNPCPAGGTITFTNVPLSTVNPGTENTFNIVPVAEDTFGNTVSGPQHQLHIDRIAPTPVNIIQLASQTDPTSNTPIFFEVTWNEPIDATTFTGAHITNGAVSAPSAGGGVWIIQDTGDSTKFLVSVSGITSDGYLRPVIANSPADVVDLAGNVAVVPGTYGADSEVLYDSTAPTAPIIVGPRYTHSDNVTDDAGTPVTGIEVQCDDSAGTDEVSLDISGVGTFGPVTCASSPVFVALPAGTLPTEGDYVVTPTAVDAVGNTQTGSSFTITYDASAPTVIITQLDITTQPDTTNSLPIFYNVNFSEAIDPATFDSSDIMDAAGSLTGVWTVSNNGDNQNFTISVNGISGIGFVQPSIMAAYTDLANNAGSASTVGPGYGNGEDDIVNFDNAPPSTPQVTDPAFANVLDPVITVNCEVGSLVQITIPGTAPAGPFPSTPITCTGTDTIDMNALGVALPSPGSYTVTAIATDVVGNVASSSPFTMVIDQATPTVEIARASSQNDPTNSQPIIFDMVFSEEIDASTLNAADIINSGTTTGNGTWTITNTGDNTNFIISLSGLSADGDITPALDIAAATRVADLSGNLLSASGNATGTTDPTVDYDGTPPSIPVVTTPDYFNTYTPTVTVNCDNTQTPADEVSVTVSGPGGSGMIFGPVDCDPANAPSGFVSIPVTIPGTAPASDGSYTVIPSAEDAVGNTALGSTFTMVIDTVAPDIIKITQIATQQDPTNQVPIYFDVEFSESIDASTFTAATITNNAIDAAANPGLNYITTSGVWSVSDTGDSKNFVVSVTGYVNVDGRVAPFIDAAAGIQDLAGNDNTAYAHPVAGDDPIVDLDNIKPTSADINSWAWNLRLPTAGDIADSGVFSQENTPIIEISSGGTNNEPDGTAQMYDDSNCTNPAGGVAVHNLDSNGLADIAGSNEINIVPGYAAGPNSVDDGEKVFYAVITDSVGNLSPCTPVGLDYVYDTTSPDVVIEQATTQLDPTKNLPIVFDIKFTEAINDTISGAYPNIAAIPLLTFGSSNLVADAEFTIQNSGDDQNFTLFVDSLENGAVVSGGALVSPGTLNIDANANQVQDLAGNLNTASIGADSEVTFNCAPRPKIDFIWNGVASQDAVNLYWFTPDETIPSAQNCTITDYFIEFKEASSPTWIEEADGLSAEAIHFHTGLTPGTVYDFRVRSFNGLYSEYSDVVTIETKPVSDYFDTTTGFKLINLSGAHNTQCVVLDDGTNITGLGPGSAVPSGTAGTAATGGTYASGPFNKGDTFTISYGGETTAAEDLGRGEVLVTDKPVFCAGKIGTGTGCGSNGNPPWVTPLWAEKTLLFAAFRNHPQTVNFFSFEAANTININRNAAPASPSSVSAGVNSLTRITNLAGTGSDNSYELAGSGFFVASRVGSGITDDMPALPQSRRLMGFPSNVGQLSTVGTGVTAEVFFSNGVQDVLTGINATARELLPEQNIEGSSLYATEPQYIEADDFVSALSTADSNGCNSAPYNPIELMQRRYGINYEADYVAFTSVVPATIIMTDPSTGLESEFTLLRTGNGPFGAKAPYKFRLENIPAGSTFEGKTVEDRFSVWYQPNAPANEPAGNDDETLVYGFD